MLSGGVGAGWYAPKYFLNCNDGQKVDHAVRELAAVSSVTFILVTVIGQVVKKDPPPWMVGDFGCHALNLLRDLVATFISNLTLVKSGGISQVPP